MATVTTKTGSVMVVRKETAAKGKRRANFLLVFSGRKSCFNPVQEDTVKIGLAKKLLVVEAFEENFFTSDFTRKKI